jgi:hypothetical protein
MSDVPDDPYEPGQRWGDLDYGSWRPTTAQRVTAGSLLAIGAFLGANYHLKWGLLGEWDKPAFVVAISIGGLLLLRIMPVPIRRLE